MQIHVVRPNETVTEISRLYQVSANELTAANELPNPDKLVPGQALVIPIVGSFYWVQRGDSLMSIARRFQTTAAELARVNGISINQPLQVGMKLYIPQRRKVNAEFNAYVEPFGETVSTNLENSAREAAPYLTYLSPFAFQVNRDGSLKEPPLGNLPDIARRNHNVLVMAINNQEQGQFSDELGRIILTDQEIQNKFLNNIVATAKKYGFRDIHIDFEYLRPQDREAYNQFLRKAKDRFSKEGWFLSTALAPKTSAGQKGRWYEAHDYKAHGEIVDFVVIMTYEWGYSGGPPMAVSPITPVRKVLEYAVTEIPSKKILMGQNLYGYDWTLPFTPGKDIAKAISPQQAIQIAANHNVPIKYDSVSQAPYIDYEDESRKKHKVWFEDARSIQAKFDLLKELNLRGMSYWKLGLSFPQNWLLIVDNFHVEKK
ncbi:glycoside hydrolase family 18 protein [Bacillus sp. FJAT-49736]|uniref:glycosyl hydrolase family 18 protein n=1 Tax=Bacillus sp. FJAT-49736 TaxID=2833582 RepID=UPI001BCA02F0|nr:glycoside hydrolase family 18 protein [Bacillus sp. FJAT-49736]MBS4175870.1 glycoside hydrolase family 18 protein [Bacillus sp. FJAT-49736]MBS4175902.1 glycoside hydrolase family 18 protein [Bacillus sp. FJAT-49736]